VNVREAAGLVAGLSLYVLMAVTAASDKSNTFDEIAHLTAGYSYWAFNDYRLQPENGNWPQRIAAAPAVLGGAAFPSRDEPAWQLADMWGVGDRFFFGVGNDIDRWLWLGRFLIALVGAGLGAVTFCWARQLTGPMGGWLALGLFVLSPTMLAHGALVTSDMSAALGLVAACGALWWLLHRVSAVTLAASVLAVTWLALAKFSAVLFVPMAVVLIGIRWRWGKARASTDRVSVVTGVGIAGLHLAVMWIAIWASYGFRYQAFSAEAPGRFSEDWSTIQTLPDGGPAPARGLVNVARDWHVLPEAYLYGFSHTVKYSQVRRSFMNGEISRSGRIGFFPYAFAVKTTLPLLILLVLGVAALVIHRPPGILYALSPLLVLVAIYGGAALMSPLNIGHRHLLPLYPIVMIVAGCSVLWLPRPAPRSAKRVAVPQWRPVAVAGVITLGGWHAVESLRVRPHYLAYFNQVVGGPSRGYLHLVDSSLDWGQDLPALKSWVDHNIHPGADAEPVYLSYFGTARPEHFGIRAEPLPGLIDQRRVITGAPLRAGIYAISATMLQGVYGVTNGPWTAQDDTQYRNLAAFMGELSSDPARRAEVARAEGRDVLPEVIDSFERFRFARLVAWLRTRPPLADAGHSILIYRLSAADLEVALGL